jgi:DNA-directed RNA polymerase alpha subunit
MDLPHSVSVKELGLSSRALTVLNSAGITTISQLFAKSDSQLLRLRNIGKTTPGEMREKLTLPFSTITASRWTMRNGCAKHAHTI